MLSSKTLNEIVSEARPIIERQLDDAERIAGFRDVVASSGGDWSALKALIKAQIQDERDETGDGKRVKKILEKAGFSTGYADMLGWSNMNEKNFSADEDHDPETGEIYDGEVDAKLIATVVTGMQTEIGRKALVAALDIMIEREEAEEQVPSSEQSEGNGSRDHQHVHSRQTDGAKHGGQDGEPAGADHATNSEMDRATEGSFETGSEAAEKGREAIPAGPEGADLSHAGAGESPATEKATVATQGEATAQTSDERVSLPVDDRSDAAANAGGDHVDGNALRVPTSNTGEGAANTALPAKPKVSFRPNCLQPEMCRSGTRDHCYSCRKAMAQHEDAA
ncbi:hypothetical protein [Shinella fusca]|uniref:Uncharacterized protein n=1 Tax=Shinella fusca TaxID=544480 RepID=A0A7W8DST6_9HYPH|nr:hypothetical protein [Shinella fusca]MBB5040832.1 hypothetical protein [Shinella fusca]